MNEILLKVQRYLDDVNFGRATIDPILIEEYGERCKELLSKKLNEKPRDKFYLRMSNLGRPICQLQAQKLGYPAEPPDNFFPMRMIYGDCIELLAIVILKGAGVDVQSEQIHVTNSDGIEGTFDVEINGKIWDIKSASAWSWVNKFDGKTIQDMWSNDPFGYTVQGIGYATSVGKPFGGWLAINKENGRWTVLEAKYDKAFEEEVLAHAKNTTEILNSDAPFKKCFEDQPEIYYKTPTNNRVLCSTCGFCAYKSSCWPNVQLLPQIPSKAQNRKLVYYTYIEPTKVAD